jgi:hypothetical protein
LAPSITNAATNSEYRSNAVAAAVAGASKSAEIGPSDTAER